MFLLMVWTHAHHECTHEHTLTDLHSTDTSSMHQHQHPSDTSVPHLQPNIDRHKCSVTLACGFASTADTQVNDACAYNMYTHIHNSLSDTYTQTHTHTHKPTGSSHSGPCQYETRLLCPGQVLRLDGRWDTMPTLKEFCLQ